MNNENSITQHWQNLNIQDVEGEEWKWIFGYENLYKVSNKGRIKSFYGNEIILKQKKVRNGYLTFGFRKPNEKRKWISIHRIVASHYIGKIPPNYTVHHDDENKTNNDYLNLKIITQLENNRYSIKSGRTKNIQGEGNPKCKLTKEMVLEIRDKRRLGTTTIKLSKEYSIGVVAIQRIISKKSWAHVC